MDVARGFQIEYPSTFLPWGATEEEVLDLLARAPRRVTDGYHTVDCTALGGLLLTAGFHFDPRQDGRLREVELFRAHSEELATSFARFQHHLELTFGPPHTTTRRPQWYPDHQWRFGHVRVRHFAQRRFVHEEHVRIETGAAVEPAT